MSLQENKKVVRRFFASEPKTQLLIRTENDLTEDCIFHTPYGDVDRFGFKHHIEELSGAFPDIEYEIDELVAEGDEVVTRWTMHGTQRDEFHGIPPTNSEITVHGTTVERFRDGKIAEGWEYYDPAEIDQQLLKASRRRRPVA